MIVILENTLRWIAFHRVPKPPVRKKNGPGNAATITAREDRPAAVGGAAGQLSTVAN